MEPKNGEVWRTTCGNRVLIVEVLDTPSTEKIGFVWWDHIDREFCISMVWNRLAEKTELTPLEWMQQCQKP